MYFRQPSGYIFLLSCDILAMVTRGCIFQTYICFRGLKKSNRLPKWWGITSHKATKKMFHIKIIWDRHSVEATKTLIWWHHSSFHLRSIRYCWCFRNPKNNHGLDGATKPWKIMGKLTTNLNWVFSPGFWLPSTVCNSYFIKSKLRRFNSQVMKKNVDHFNSPDCWRHTSTLVVEPSSWKNISQIGNLPEVGVKKTIIPARDPKQCQKKKKKTMKGRDTTGQSSHTSHNICNQFSDRMLQSGEKYENYHGPERTCLCSRYHAIYGRDTTDQNEPVFAVYIIQFTVVIPRTRTNMFVQYMFCNHKMYKGTTIRRAAFSFNSPSRQLQHVAQGGREAADNLTTSMPLSIGRQGLVSVPRLQEDQLGALAFLPTAKPRASFFSL